MNSNIMSDKVDNTNIIEKINKIIKKNDTNIINIKYNNNEIKNKKTIF